MQKCIIIRAAAFDSDGNHVGATTTNSYFIKSLDDYPTDLPVVSLCADSTALFGYEEGIYLHGGAHNNSLQHGMEWERLCNVEFYEHNNSGINQLAGNYAMIDHNIYMNVAAVTEIHDATGWEERMLNALNNSSVCEVGYYGRTMRIYYDLNRKYMDFVRAD